MNEKEKAQDIYLTFWNTSVVRYERNPEYKRLVKEDKETALRSAIAHVDMLLKCLNGIEYDFSVVLADTHIPYYESVRKELIKLSSKPIPSFI